MQPKTFPDESRALVAIDLGAESCRVSLLRWSDDKPQVTMVHRFPTAAVERPDGFHWDLTDICNELQIALVKCSELAAEGIASIAVDGWSVDYVRLNESGVPMQLPFCYRDQRTVSIEMAAHRKLDRGRLYALTGTAQLRINTLYQLMADNAASIDPDAPWAMLPEYILMWLGGDRVGEWTNATHTGLVDLDKRQWCREIFDELELSMAAAPRLVKPGTVVGNVRGTLAALPAFAKTELIAAACHDTASAVAGLPAVGDDWAYLSSGTWSLIGAVLQKPCNTPEAQAAGFTNIGAASGICFHKLINGLWLLRQSMEQWASAGQIWTVGDLVMATESAVAPHGHIDPDDPDLLLPGDMPARINKQRARLGFTPVDTADAPVLARLIFESLAAKYAQVLADITKITGKTLKRLYIVGGGSQNELLNRLTAQAAGVEVHRGAVESSTIGNFAIQLATHEGSGELDAAAVAKWAGKLL